MQNRNPIHGNQGSATFIFYLGHPLHSDSPWPGENPVGECCSWSQPANRSRSRTLQWQAQHWGREGPPPVRSPPQNQNHWTGERIHGASLSSITFRYIESFSTGHRNTCLPLRGHSSSLHFQRPKQVPGHQHPALSHPKHIATRDCSCFSLTWQQWPQQSQNQPVRTQLIPAALKSISPTARRQHDNTSVSVPVKIFVFPFTTGLEAFFFFFGGRGGVTVGSYYNT